MATSGTLKMKMLALWEILRQESDAEHPLSTNQLCRKLQERGIPCERKSIATDMALFKEHGFDVESKKVGRERVYYVEDRLFNVPELKIIIDAVQAASFVTESKTAELTEKIAALGGSHRAEILKGSLVHFNTRKHTNEAMASSGRTCRRSTERAKSEEATSGRYGQKTTPSSSKIFLRKMLQNSFGWHLNKQRNITISKTVCHK